MNSLRLTHQVWYQFLESFCLKKKYNKMNSKEGGLSLVNYINFVTFPLLYFYFDRQAYDLFYFYFTFYFVHSPDDCNSFQVFNAGLTVVSKVFDVFLTVGPAVVTTSRK